MDSPKRKTAGKNRKTRAELNIEGRERKHQKKHRGNSPGSRYHDQSGSGKNSQDKVGADPRLGSKVPVALIIDESAKKASVAKKVAAAKEPVVTISPEKELAMLENDDRLDALLTRLENSETLNREEHQYINTKLDRIDTLMKLLGIEFPEEDEDEEKQDDIMQLLKGK